MDNKKKYILPTVSLILFILLIVILKTVDTAKTGVGDTEIGLYHLNIAASKFIGTNMAWYKITEILGMLSILSGAVFGAVGLLQMIKRKSLIKVDREILSLGGLYVLLGIVYAFFEKVIINYRPLIMDGETAPEASFPSSHTVLAVVIMGSVFLILDKYIKNKTVANILKSLCLAVAVITVIGRLLSGVHWLTDILAGILISICLLSLFKAVKE